MSFRAHLDGIEARHQNDEQGQVGSKLEGRHVGQNSTIQIGPLHPFASLNIKWQQHRGWLFKPLSASQIQKLHFSKM